jgi:hypothetical protein
MLIGTYLVYYFFWREIADITADVSSNKAGAEAKEEPKDEPAKEENVDAFPDVEEVESA